MWLLAEDWQVIIYRFMYRWINTWLNVVEHVMIEYTGMMSWLFPALELKKYYTMQYEVMGHHQLLGHRVQQMAFTGVTDSRSLCRDKLHFSQNILCNCGICNAVWSNPMCNRPWPGPTKPVGQHAGWVIHWISMEEWHVGSSPHSGLQSQP